MSRFISFVRIPALAARHLMSPSPALDVLGEDRLKMSVLPNDIDLNMHMNNARYLSLMDYARMRFLARTRLLEHMLRLRWRPLIGAVWITYRRSLPLFAKFEMTSRFVCWDERWFYIEQTFTGSKGLAAVGWVKGMLRDGKETVAPQKAIDAAALGTASPQMPEEFAAWKELTREKLAGS